MSKMMTTRMVVLFVVCLIKLCYSKSIPHDYKATNENDVTTNNNNNKIADSLNGVEDKKETGDDICDVDKWKESDIVMDKIYHINHCHDTSGKEDGLYGLDMKMKDERRVRRASLSDGLSDWPKSSDGLVYIPYLAVEDLASSVKEGIEAARKDYDNKTCIRFIPRKTEKNFVFIFSSKQGCWSFVGMQGGRQDVSLDYNCNSKGIIIHEFMHVLGFGHEQSRRDRDEYITIHWENVLPKHRRDFQMDPYGRMVVHGEPYDYKSVMHYGNNIGGSSTDKITLSSNRDPAMILGQRDGFSKQDLREINLKYSCGKRYVTYN